MKLSELNGRLQGIEQKIDSILASVGDPQIPADAEETLVRIDTKLAQVPVPAP